MPEPVSRYHVPLAFNGSIPVSCHKRISLLWVPESSPRDANMARAWASLASAAVASRMPRTPAGSRLGPTMTKSLYMRSDRLTP